MKSHKSIPLESPPILSFQKNLNVVPRGARASGSAGLGVECSVWPQSCVDASGPEEKGRAGECSFPWEPHPSTHPRIPARELCVSPSLQALRSPGTAPAASVHLHSCPPLWAEKRTSNPCRGHPSLLTALRAQPILTHTPGEIRPMLCLVGAKHRHTPVLFHFPATINGGWWEQRSVVSKLPSPGSCPPASR